MKRERSSFPTAGPTWTRHPCERLGGPLYVKSDNEHTRWHCWQGACRDQLRLWAGKR